MSTFFDVNDIQLHAIDRPGDAPTLILLPGLTANARCFDGMVAAGLNQLHTVALDLRGRGRSDKPDSGYTIADHAADVLGVIDALGLDKATLVGHSFGGLVSYYMAAHFPERIERLVVMDAAKAATDPRVAEMLRPSLSRLGQTWPSAETYLDTMRQMPFWNGEWNAHLEAFYRADMQELPDGHVKPRSTAEGIGQVIDGVIGEDWEYVFDHVSQPTLLINATEPYGPMGPLVPQEQAWATAELLPNCRYAHVDGNHVTMLFGTGGQQTTAAILDFVGAAK